MRIRLGMRFIASLLLIAIASVAITRQGSVHAQVEKASLLTLTPCEIPGVEGKARCGSYEVFENRATQKGRKITLKIVVLPATGKPEDRRQETGDRGQEAGGRRQDAGRAESAVSTGGERAVTGASPATGVELAADPFVYIPGGPGSSAIEDAPGIAQAFAKVREGRDLVFVDQRGTGGSHPLNCDLFTPGDPQSYLGYFFPLDDVKKCREQLERKADLTLYTTPIAMDDLDEVRAALGYERVNLFGASYGTRAALVYLKRHPKSVRTVTLHGVAPTNQYMPLAFAQSNERALMGIIHECAADEACNKAFPNLGAEAKAVLERLLKGTIEVEVPWGETENRKQNTENRIQKTEGRNQAAGAGGGRQGQHEEGRRQKAEGRKQEAAGASREIDQEAGAGGRRQVGGTKDEGRTKVRLSRDLAAEAVRYMLYSPGGASRVPLVLHLAAQGDFGPLAEAALNYRRQIVATGSNGLYLSITCAEDLPWIKAGEGERSSANTFLGDYRLRQQREACALWPRATIPTDYSVPTKGSAPVLIFTGEWDPVTPPSNGDAVAQHLPNSLHVIVPDGAHGIGGLEGVDCIGRLNTEFVERGTVKGLDTSCVRNIRRKGFATK